MDRAELISFIMKHEKPYLLSDLEKMDDFQLRSIAQKLISEQRLKSESTKKVKG